MITNMQWLTRSGANPVMWWAIFLASLAPFILLVFNIFTRNLGADPAEAIARDLGYWAMVMLWITLSVTPLNRWFGWRALIRYRRMLGLYAFFYASLHMLAGFGLVLDLGNFVNELVKRPYITIGAVAFIILLALAITSPKRMVRKLGKRWKKLHRSVYVAAILVIAHFVWLTRADYTEPVLFGLLLALLLGSRLYHRLKVMRPATAVSQ